MYFIGFFVFTYLVGSIPFGLLISRFWLKIDIRQKGSGNIGMTNVMRVGGKLPGIVTFALDFGKGSIVVLLAKIFLLDPENKPEDQIIFQSFVGVIVVLGHVFSIFLNFKGGKGISTLFGVLIILDLSIGILAAIIWVGIFFWKKISSLSGITMLSCLPFLFLFVPWLKNDSPVWTIFLLFLMLSLLLIYTHKDNIKRLLKGQETKLNSSNNPNNLSK